MLKCCRCSDAGADQTRPAQTMQPPTVWHRASGINQSSICMGRISFLKRTVRATYFNVRYLAYVSYMKHTLSFFVLILLWLHCIISALWNCEQLPQVLTMLYYIHALYHCVMCMVFLIDCRMKRTRVICNYVYFIFWNIRMYHTRILFSRCVRIKLWHQFSDHINAFEYSSWTHSILAESPHMLNRLTQSCTGALHLHNLKLPALPWKTGQWQSPVKFSHLPTCPHAYTPV